MGKRACTTILTLLLIACLGGAQAAPLPLEERTLRRLEELGELQSSLAGGTAPALMPLIGQREELIQAVRRLGLTTGVELLRLYEGQTDWSTPEAHLRIYNVLLSVGSMKGIQYYSASRKKMRTLFAESYLVDGPQTAVPQPDPVLDSIAADSTVYMFQEDLTFGKNLYRSRLRYVEGCFLVETSNLTVMRYLRLPMVQPENSYSLVLLVPADGRILFYGVAGAHTARFLGLERTKEDSFYNRLQALYGWFASRMRENP